MFELLAAGRMRAPLDAALAREVRRADVLVARTAQVLFAGGVLAGVGIALATSREVGSAIAGASVLYLAFATVMSILFSRGVDTPAVYVFDTIGASSVPWVYLVALAITDGPADALSSWVPPLLYASMVIGGMARL